jgi:hypothetical protein
MCSAARVDGEVVQLLRPLRAHRVSKQAEPGPAQAGREAAGDQGVSSR